MSKKKHDHNRTSWLIAGGYIMWCYECGAFKHMERVEGTTNGFKSASVWRKPTGIGSGINPWEKYKDY